MTFVTSFAPLNLALASSAGVNVLFSRTGGGEMVGEWGENRKWQWAPPYFFFFSQSQTLTVNVSITKELPAQEANLVASVWFFFYYGDDSSSHWHLIHYQTTSAGITYLHVSMLWCFRGQDVSAFQPTPDIILVADCIYYEEVRVFMFPLQIKAYLDIAEMLFVMI